MDQDDPRLGRTGATAAASLRPAVAALPALEGLPPAQIDALLAEAHPVAVATGAALFRQGEEARSFYILLCGHLRVSKLTPDGKQVLVRYIHPGDPCGIAVAMGWRAYPATAEAVADCLLVGWPSAAWPRLAREVPALTMKLMQSLGPRLNDSHARVMEMSTAPVEQRLAHALLRLAERAGRPAEGGTEIAFPISRQDLAELAGTTLHTASRIMSGWEDRRLVSGGRRRVVLRDAPALMQVAQMRPGQG